MTDYLFMYTLQSIILLYAASTGCVTDVDHNNFETMIRADVLNNDLARNFSISKQNVGICLENKKRSGIIANSLNITIPEAKWNIPACAWWCVGSQATPEITGTPEQMLELCAHNCVKVEYE